MISPSGLHVLIIDDVAEDRTWIAHNLRQTFARPLLFSEAATGTAGIQYYQQPTTQRAQAAADLILLSRNLPDLTYLEVLQQLQGEIGYLPVPVLVLTTVLDDELTYQALTAGAQDIIDKPQITPDHLRHVVLAALARFTLIQKLRASEDHLRLALEVGEIGTWQWDIAANQITWDRREYALVGLDPQTTILKTDTFLACIHPEDRPEHILKTHAQLAYGKAYQETLRIVRPDGTIRWLDGHCTVIRDDQGRPLRVIGVNYDITACKDQATERKALDETLEQRVAERIDELTRRNQELNQFAYIAAHDLKAPLRAIDNLAGWIAEDTTSVLSPDSQEHLIKLRGRLKRMQKLLDDLLTYSRAGRQRGKPEPVDIAALITGLLRLLPLPANFRITIEDEMPVLLTQRVPLELILRNLLDNAIKHHDRTVGNVHIAAHDMHDIVEFSVADDGPGIPEIFHQRIFQMFQTLQPRDKIEGSGMGLAIVKKIIESRGGAINVVSGHGRGATFRFTWPKVV